MSFVIHLPYEVADGTSLVRVPLEFLRHFSKEVWVHPKALVQFQNMHLSARKEGVELLILSGWRSFKEQDSQFHDAERRHGMGKGILWVAPAGYSEHHTGFVLDIADGSRPETDDEPTFETTTAFRWLLKNGERYGFKLSFPRKNWQRVSYEPWHWRYIGNKESHKIFFPPFYIFTIKMLKGFLKGIKLPSP